MHLPRAGRVAVSGNLVAGGVVPSASPFTRPTTDVWRLASPHVSAQGNARDYRASKWVSEHEVDDQLDRQGRWLLIDLGDDGAAVALRSQGRHLRAVEFTLASALRRVSSAR